MRVYHHWGDAGTIHKTGDHVVRRTDIQAVLVCIEIVGLTATVLQRCTRGWIYGYGTALLQQRIVAAAVTIQSCRRDSTGWVANSVWLV